MAIPRLSVKVGKVGKAQPHASYIARQDKYAHKLETGEKLEATGHGNMPDWAKHDPLIFWQAADLNERKNGSTYREHEIALPRELSESQRSDLLDDWIKNEIGDKYAYQYAIHTPKAEDGKEQPHVHLMFSERKLDGIKRDPDQFFKRFNGKHPERGGAKKDNTGKGHKERRQNLKDIRHRWEVMCNNHLERAGLETRIDMRSYKDQGKEIIPEKKVGPKAWRNPKRKAEVIELREIKKALVEFVGDAKKFLTRIQSDKKKAKEQEWLTPKNIEKVFGEILKRTEKFVQNHYDKLDKAKADATKALQNHQKTKPEEFDFASKVPLTNQYVMLPHQETKYKNAAKTWEDQNDELRATERNAEHSVQYRHQTIEHPRAAANRLLKEKHPELAEKREALEKEKQEQEAAQRRKSRPKSKDRDTGR